MSGDTVGVRSSWFCSRCTAQSKTYQLLPVDGSQTLAMPPGWHVERGRAVCDAHAERAVQAA